MRHMRNRDCEERRRSLAPIWRLALTLAAGLALLAPTGARGQVATTTVQGTIYRADGTPATGTALVSWPAFTTPQAQAVAAGSLSAAIGANGYLSVNLTPNAGAVPAGSYYTVVYHLSDGTVNREYWVVPAAGTASVASVRAQLEPSTVAVQPSVTTAYVQGALSSLTSTYLPLAGGTLSGPLTLNSDPTSAGQAATKHYADQLAAQELPLAGGSMSGPLTAPSITAKTTDGRMNAEQWQSSTGSNDGIAMSLRECESLPYACEVMAPALYSTAEEQPWGGSMQWTWALGAFQGPPAGTPPGCVEDRRFGAPEWLCTPAGAPSWAGGSSRFSMGASFTTYLTSPEQAFSPWPAAGLWVNKIDLLGTRNFSGAVPNSGGQTTNNGIVSNASVFAPASTNGIASWVQGHAPGDQIGLYSWVTSWGGISAADNEGNEDRLAHNEAGDVYQGTIDSIASQAGGSSPCTGPCYVIATSQTQGMKGSLGDQLADVDLSRGDSSGYISGIGGNGVVTTSGSDWDSVYGVSNAHTTTTAPISNPDGTTVNTFPRTDVVVPVAAADGFVVGKPACLFDLSGVNWECQTVTAVDTAANVITFAVVDVPYLSGSTVAQGGMTGMGFSARADNIAPGGGGMPSADIGVQNTIRSVWPIEYNTSGGVARIISGNRIGFSYVATRAYQTMGGSGGACAATLSNGSIASCSCSGGSGYIDTAHPPQLTVTGITGSAQPSIYVSGISGGALTACTVASGGSGLSGTPSVTVTTANSYTVYPMARTIHVWNPATGAVDGSSIATDQLMPASSAWKTGDTLEQEHSVAMEFPGIQEHVTQYQPGASTEDGRELWISGAFRSNDYGDWMNNSNDPGLYSGSPLSRPWQPGYGQMTTPYGYVLDGDWRDGLYLRMPPHDSAAAPGLSGAVVVGCFDYYTQQSVCSSWNQSYNVLTVQNQNQDGWAEDVQSYNPVTQTWTLTAGATQRSGGAAPVSRTLSPSAGFSWTTGMSHHMTLDNRGDLSVPGGVTGASINGDVTVDGSTYPTLNAAWNAAVAQANATGQDQTVRLGPGTYPVSATLAEPSGGACVNLLGSGGATPTADSPQVATTLTVPNPIGGDVIALGNTTQAQGCTFRDLNILAQGHATHGFELQWFRGLLIDDVTVNDTTAEGMLLGEEDTSAGHQSNFLLRDVTVSYSSAAFTPAGRPAYGIHILKTAMDSALDNITVRNALTASVYNEGTGNTGYLIHGFGYPYTCATAPCANNASSSSAADASYATSYVVYDTGGGGSEWTDTYIDSPAVAGFYIGANGVSVEGGHIQWPDLTSFPSANLAYVAATVTNNLLIGDVSCLGMAGGTHWITYAGTSGNPPSFSSVHHLTGCGNYYQALEPAVTTGFSSGGANINDPSGAVPRVWATPLAAAAGDAAYSAQMYTGYQGDAYQAHFSGVNPFFNVTYQGTIRSNGGLALNTVINTASTMALTSASRNVIANAAAGPQTITLPSCYTPLADHTSPTGLELTIIKSDNSANAVTLQAVSSQNIDYNGVSAQTLTISSPGARTLVCGPDYNWYAR